MTENRNLKLSEAMRLGSLLRPQTYGPFVDKCGTCAMGAALEAIGQLKVANTKKTNSTSINTQRVKRIWPWLKWRLKLDRCPWCGAWEGFCNVFNLIVHLNDEDKLSRSQIAEMLSRVEAQATGQLEMVADDESREKQLDQLRANLPAARKTKARKNAAEKGNVEGDRLVQHP